MARVYERLSGRYCSGDDGKIMIPCGAAPAVETKRDESRDYDTRPRLESATIFCIGWARRF